VAVNSFLEEQGDGILCTKKNFSFVDFFENFF